MTEQNAKYDFDLKRYVLGYTELIYYDPQTWREAFRQTVPVVGLLVAGQTNYGRLVLAEAPND